MLNIHKYQLCIIFIHINSRGGVMHFYHGGTITDTKNNSRVWWQWVIMYNLQPSIRLPAMYNCILKILETNLKSEKNYKLLPRMFVDFIILNCL